MKKKKVVKKVSKKKEKQKITKDMYFADVISYYPETMEVFLNKGMHCVGCVAARFESIEQGAMAHGVDPDKLVEELNKKIKKKK
jgi:hybrid cluster-associated redox disulfide protein